MKKAGCLIIAAAMIMTNATFALADSTEIAKDDLALEAEGQVAEVVYAEAEEDADIELFAAVDAVTLEYDESASTDYTRVVKVKYSQSHFTTGINSFKVQLSLPSAYVSDVNYSSNLTGFSISQSYSAGLYTCEGVGLSDQAPWDGCLFTITIELSQLLKTSATVSITGDTQVGDSTGTTYKLSNGGILPASVTLPPKGDDDGSGTGWRQEGDTLYIHSSGTMPDYAKETAPWYTGLEGRRGEIKKIVFEASDTHNVGAGAFYGFSSVQQVTLAENILTIGDGAFEDCSSLSTINFSAAQRTSIGAGAFRNCTSLTSFVAPDSVKTIGRGAFAGCTRLNSITLPFIGSQTGSANSTDTFSYIFDGTVPSSLKTVTITSDTVVPDSAFAGCAGISSVSLNPAIRKIGQKAFSGCSSLTSVNIPDGITEINSYTFENCSSLPGVTIPSSVTKIGEGAFDGCRALRSVDLPEIKEIAPYTFRNCASLTAIEIPTSVTKIGASVLEGCNRLIDISVPFVGANADPGATAATPNGIFGYFFGTANNGDVPPAVTKVVVTGTSRTGYIPKGAFKGCSNIEDIIIEGGRAVLDGAFANCRNLKNLRLPKSLSTIGTANGERILSGSTKLETLQVPFIGLSRSDTNTQTSVLGNFFGYNDQDITGIMQYYDGVNYHYYKIPTTLETVTVLNHTDIPAGAFSECSFIKKIFVTSGASMGKRAFYHCDALEEVTLPKDLQDIGEQAFAECESLKTINIPTKVRNIGSNAFYNDRELENVTMPDSVTTIADDVFNGTNLYSAGGISLMATPLTITCSEGSAAYNFAKEHGIKTNVVSSSELNVTEVGASISQLSTGEYIVDVSDTNNLQNGTVYAVMYDASGKPVAVQTQKTTADLDGIGVYRFTFSKDEGDKMSTAKVFIWANKSVNALTSRAKAFTK